MVFAVVAAAGRSQVMNILMADTLLNYGYSENDFPVSYPYGNAVINYDGFVYYFMMSPVYNTTMTIPENTLPAPAVYVMDGNGHLNSLCMNSDWNPASNIINYFGYYQEGKENVKPVFYARSFAWVFNGRLWYYENIRNLAKDSLYECYAQLPPANQPGRCIAYSTTAKLFKDNNNLNYVKQAGFQSGSDQYFIAGGLLNELQYPRWILQRYTYNTPKSAFDWKSDTELAPMKNCGTIMGDIILKRDINSGIDYVYCCTSDDLNVWLWQLTMEEGIPEVQLIEHVFNPEGLGVGGATLVQGSVQGSRPPQEPYLMYPDQSDRIAMFIVAGKKLSGDYPFLYREYYIQDFKPHITGFGAIQVPSGEYSFKVYDNFLLQAVNWLKPAHLSDEISNDPTFLDGFYQRVYVFYNWQHNYLITPGPDLLRAFGLNSDIWRPAADSVTVLSNDLQSVATYGASVRNLWALIGIVDGAPPCSVKWHEWDSLVKTAPWYKPEPTNLDLNLTQSSNLEITNTYEDQFSEGFSMKSLNKGLTGGFEENYSQAWKQVNTSGVTQKVTWKTGFPLSEDLQEFGNFLWAVPEIRRITFLRYPWWDNSKFGAFPGMGAFKHPVTSSQQFLFRNYGMQIFNDTVPLSDFPFRVNDPNGPNLSSWNLDNRTMLNQAVTSHPISNLGSATWYAPSQPVNISFEQAENTKTTSETSSSFDVKVSGSVKVPKVFKMDVELGYEVKYSAEVSSECEMGKEATLQINDYMSDLTGGLNMTKMSVDLYWLTPQDGVNYWYWDSLPVPGQRPWYIAYVAYQPMVSIELLSPPDSSKVWNGEGIFTWTTGDSFDSNFEFYISASWPVRPASVIYSELTGHGTLATPYGFSPVPGKTYYWAVRGTDAYGHIVWSRPRTFRIPAEGETAMDNIVLKALVWPNPGKASDIRIMLESKPPQPVEMILRGLDGRILFNDKLEATTYGTLNLHLPGLPLKAGIYFLEFITPDSRTIRKMILL